MQGSYNALFCVTWTAPQSKERLEKKDETLVQDINIAPKKRSFLLSLSPQHKYFANILCR